MLNPDQPLYFYDDRNKTDFLLKLSRVIHIENNKMMCEVEAYDPITKEVNEKDVVLVNLDTGEIESEYWMFWYGTNDMNLIQELDKKNIQRLEQRG